MFDRVLSFLKMLGPGLTTGASDDDPSGIATYSQAGAQFGFFALWTAFFTLPFMIAIQEMCARIGIVTKKGLTTNFRAHFPPHIIAAFIFLLALANVLNLGADLGMMAAAAQLVIPLPFFEWLMVFIFLTLFLQIFLKYKTYASYLKWLAITLFLYVIVAALVRIPWGEAIHLTIIPHVKWTKEYLLLIIALLGTTISPYLYFWQTNQEVEEGYKVNRVEGVREDRADRRVKRSFWDVCTGMGLSNVISWFVILTAAAVLHAHGVNNIETADQAARVLAPLAGRFTSTVFALGIIGMGLLAVPVLSGVIGYALCELRGSVKVSLSNTWRQAPYFYGVIIVATLLGASVNALRVSPVKLLIYSAIANAVISPPMIYAILRVAGDPILMKGQVNGRWSKIFGWATFFLMSIASVLGLIFSF